MTLVNRLSDEIEALLHLIKTKPVKAFFVFLLICCVVFVLYGDKIMANWTSLTATETNSIADETFPSPAPLKQKPEPDDNSNRRRDDREEP